MSGIYLQFDPEVLRPMVEQIVAQVIARLESTQLANADKFAYTEAEAARMLSLKPHQLRDERLRGRIRASSIVGRRIRYQKQDLLIYLADREWRPG